MSEAAEVSNFVDLAGGESGTATATNEPTSAQIDTQVSAPGQQEHEPSNHDQMESNWLWADGVNGDGDKPDWLQGRYKSVADQAKAYTELEKKFGEFQGAPKDGYKFDDFDGINPEDPLVNHFAQTFKDLNLSQNGFNRIVNEFAEFQMNHAKQAMEQEYKALGPNGKQQVNQVSTWIDNTFNDDVAATMKNWLMSKADVEAVQALMSIQPSSNVPTAQGYGAQQPSYESSQEVINEKTTNWSRYQEDVNYRNSVQARLAAAVRREDKLKKG